MRLNPKVLFFLLLVITSISGYAQSSKKNPTVPSFTPANERKVGFAQRQSLIENSLVKNLSFRNVGPTVMSGRVVDIEVDPSDPTHFYVAYASGGLWETTTEGTSFTPLFDHEMVMTIGDIAVDWKNNILYVGSGENNSSRSSYSGFGVFKSMDNGKTWTHLGLEETHHIGRVICHPTDPNILWVGALGHLYSNNDQRGVYRSTDGGKIWEKTLFINDRTGIVDLVLNPKNAKELLAAAWEKDRKAWNFEEAGPGSAIYKSNDGGITWTNISSGNNGFPDTKGTGRLGLTYFPADPSIIYAVVDNQEFREEKKSETNGLTRDLLKNLSKDSFLALENDSINAFLDREDFDSEFNAVDLKEQIASGKIQPKDLITYLEDANSLLFNTPVKGSEVYKSTDGGETWIKTHEGYLESLTYSYGYYFGQIRTSSKDPNILYTMGVPLIKSNDGGKTWAMTTMDNVHADHHALWVDPNKEGHLINGNDGGVHISYDNGETWVKCNSIPVGQFYSVNVDMAEPYNVYGGLQDNGVWMGSSTYEYNRSWYQEGHYPYKSIMGGDGMQVAIDTRDNETVYTGYQFGNYFRLNTRTGDVKSITPKHTLGESPYRWNWQSPIQVSIHNQDIVYFGSHRFHRSMNQGDSFETLSDDLTNGGKKGDVSYGTLTSISESPLSFGLIYTGSDDGLIHVSKDAGATWTRISNSLPKDLWVSRVTASSHEKSRVYCSLNGYRWDHFEAYIYVSENLGDDWKRIGLNLPKEPVNVIKEDPTNENILYVGTDHGVYISMDRGQTFMAFSKGLPAVAVHDLVIQSQAKDLVLGTHGRSLFIADLEPIYFLMAHKNDTLTVFEIEDITYSNKWGTRNEWYWDGYIEPEMKLLVQSTSASEATLQILKDSVEVNKWSTSLDPGLNFLTYDYTMPDDKGEKKANGKVYLTEGEYQLKVIANSATSTQSFSIEKPRPKEKRKGSE